MQRSVDEENAGLRLDLFLARELKLSRGYVRRLLALDNVRVNGASGIKGMLLRSRDVIEVDEFRHPSEGPAANPELELSILVEGRDLLAVDKPAGRATQPLDYEETDTVLNAVLARFPEVAGVGEGGLMSGVVHRLDRDTSGVLVFARTEAGWQGARSAFQTRSVEKTYRALVHGRLEGPRDVELQLAHRGDRMSVVGRTGRGGRPAATHLDSLEFREDTTLVEARPITGLMHQLRVTLAELGHPIVGDALYGSPLEQERHWLHATSIRIDAGDAVPGLEASSPAPELLRPASAHQSAEEARRLS